MCRLPALLLFAALAGTAGTAAWADDPPKTAADQAPANQAAPASPATDRAPSHASSASQSSSAPAAADRKPLDLSAPPINHVLSNEQVQAMVTERDEEPVDSVSVVTDYPQIEVPQGQLRAFPWAVLHPLDAWRIFAPVTD
jgi:hypothetical protein